MSSLVAFNPTPKPGLVSNFSPLSVGTWRVFHAPHIKSLSLLSPVNFTSVEYKLSRSKAKGGQDEMLSTVAYELPGGIKGLLYARGEVGGVGWVRVWGRRASGLTLLVKKIW